MLLKNNVIFQERRQGRGGGGGAGEGDQFPLDFKI